MHASAGQHSHHVKGRQELPAPGAVNMFYLLFLLACAYQVPLTLLTWNAMLGPTWVWYTRPLGASSGLPKYILYEYILNCAACKHHRLTPVAKRA
jgi:hypothetical protein